MSDKDAVRKKKQQESVLALRFTKWLIDNRFTVYDFGLITPPNDKKSRNKNWGWKVPLNSYKFFEYWYQIKKTNYMSDLQLVWIRKSIKY